MNATVLDPLIHDPERLRIVATLAALPDGDVLSLARLRDMTGLPPAGQLTRLRELGRAGYVRSDQAGDDAAHTTVALTCDGRAALKRYAAGLRRLSQVATEERRAPAPGVRAGDADRDAAAAALGEHFAQGRLTLEELDTRLDAALTATTHGQLSQAAWDLPDLRVLPAGVSLPRGKGVRPGRRPGPAPGHGAWPRRRG